MPVTEIYIVRHGQRNSWVVDRIEGVYRPAQNNPTGIANDPPLTDHGREQAEQLGPGLEQLLPYDQPRRRLVVFSSPYYRCLETIAPAIKTLRSRGWPGRVHIEAGLSEWFGTHPFNHPAGATASVLHNHFDFVDPNYQSQVHPTLGPEPIDTLYQRLESTLRSVIRQAEGEAAAQGQQDDDITLLLACHTAVIVSASRVLTGRMPTTPEVEDFKCFTAGLSKFIKKSATETHETAGRKDGVPGGWECTMNSFCGYLKDGEEGGWHFHGNYCQDLQIYADDKGQRIETHDFVMR